MGLASIVVIAITYTIGWRPFLGPRSRSLTARKFEATPERLARGRYLANGVTGCMHCHSEHDWKRWAVLLSKQSSEPVKYFLRAISREW
jgi:hypothetical protein